MDDRYRQSLLFDFYGELLNEHQKTVFSAAIFDDMSYSELADEFECSRQAAFDLVRRINAKLESYESRLGLLKRFTDAKDKMKSIDTCVDRMQSIINNNENVIDSDRRAELLLYLNQIAEESKNIFDEI